MKKESLTDVLIYGTKEGNLEVVLFCHKHGADINAVDENGNTPLTLAILAGYTLIANYLIDNGAVLSKDSKIFELENKAEYYYGA